MNGGVETRFRSPHRIFVGGQWVDASAAGLIDVISPTDERLYYQVAAAGVGDVERAVAAARRAFDYGPWPRMSHEERAGWMNLLADELANRADDIAELWPNEMGITHALASAIAPAAADFYRYYAGLAGKFPFEEQHETVSGAKIGLLVQEPVGVVGAIIPWNSPVMITAFKVAPALLAGCTLVVKGPPEAPGHALVLAEVAEKIGLPEGVINVLIADREASESLVRNRDVDKISFTGSSATGRRIAAIVGERMGRFTLELGGKSAAIILDDFDAEVAAKELAERVCEMSGQVCACLSRIVVPQHRARQVTDAIAAAFASVQVGDPFAIETQMGPVATRTQRDRVEGHIGRAKAAGLRVAAGGGRPAHLDRGFFIEPTVFAEVPRDAAIAQEEVFGPVLSVIPVRDEDDAIRVANDSQFGLNGAVFSNDPDRVYAIARKLRTGTVSQNGRLADFTIGFGGFKQSGIGREGGVEGLRPYLEAKTILLSGNPSRLAGPRPA